MAQESANQRTPGTTFAAMLQIESFGIASRGRTSDVAISVPQTRRQDDDDAQGDHCDDQHRNASNTPNE